MRYELDLERPTDWMKERGSLLNLKTGPFRFCVNTADGGAFGFYLVIGRWNFGWGIDRWGDDE